jgi:ribosome-binding factor A
MRRKDKVQEVIREEMGKILQEELHDPRIGFVTVTRVEMTDDLRYAKIYYSVLGSKKDIQATTSALNSAAGFIRRLIAQRVNLRFVPEIILKLDTSSREAIRLEEIFQEIKDELKKDKENNKSV